MVPLTAVPSEFAGRVLVAKLGSAGILAELRGVSRVYPSLLDAPHVWVEEDEFVDARELISADLDTVLPADEDDRGWGVDQPAVPSTRWARSAMAAVALLVLVSFGYGVRSCGTQSTPTLSHSR